MPVVVRPCAYADIESAPEFPALLDAYSRESSIDQEWTAQPQRDIYLGMEAVGVMHAFGAYQGDALIGFASILVTVLPHFGRLTAVTESFFVMPESRDTGAGMKLLRAMEHRAAELGADGLLASAPIGGQLDKVLHGLSAYRPTNRVHFRRLKP